MNKNVKKEIYNDIKKRHMSISGWFSDNKNSNENTNDDNSFCDKQKMYNSLLNSSSISINDYYTSLNSTLVDIERDIINIKKKINIEDRYGKVYITPHEFNSSFNNNKNIFAIIEVIKNILIDKNIISEDEFDKIYDNIQSEYMDKIESYKLADKLCEDSKKKTFDMDYNRVWRI